MFGLFSLLLLLGCTDHGWVEGPIGWTELRTARFRLSPRENRQELLIFLSNGAYPECYLPQLSEPKDQARAGQAAVVATCRERAQHVLLALYTEREDWTGTYANDAEAQIADVGIDRPAFVRSRYLGIREAHLVSIDELLRTYEATDYEVRDLVEGPGEVTIDLATEARVRGRFLLGDEIAGDFSAEPCEGDTSLLDMAEQDWLDRFCAPRR